MTRHRRTRYPTTPAIVNHIFDRYRRPDGSEYSHTEVADSMSANRSHISKLRSGVIANPTIETVTDFCNFFGEDPAIFFPIFWDQFHPHFWQRFPDFDEYATGVPK